jgi:hypothetical protein
VLRGRAAGGRFDLSQSTFRFTDRERALRCLAVTRRGKTLSNPFDCLALTETGQHLSTRTMNGEVRCDLRGAFVVGGASRRAASVRARLDDGSTVAGRLFGSALGRAFLVSPPAGRGLRRVEVLDRAGKRLQRYAGRVPPAKEQCGYSFSLFARGAHAARSTSEAGASEPTARAVRPAVPGRVGQPYTAHRSFRLTGRQWQTR